MTGSFWTIDRIANALGDRVIVPPAQGCTPITGISTDTRAIAPGSCFVALVGERYDAHQFVDAAIAAGAAAAVVSRVPERGGCDVPFFVVDDTLLALGALARYRRESWAGPLAAVAGSNGKTSTKELLRAALSSRYIVHATERNFNNRVGVPLTLLAMRDAAEVAVVELGTSIPGEIAALCQIARPDVAVVTSIAEEHLERFGDISGVLREEAAVFDGTPLAVIPSDETDLAAEAMRRADRVIRVGLDDGDVSAESWRIEPDGTGTVVLDGITVHSPMRGVHNLRNLMLALVASRELGAAVKDAAVGISELKPPPMRAIWERIGSALVINDAYNSNPGSAFAALEMLRSAPGAQKIAILGTMRELGANSARCHDDVARAALAAGVDIVAGIGDFGDALARVGAGREGEGEGEGGGGQYGERIVTAPDVDELWTQLEPRLAPDATILLKASRGVQLERILPHISEWAGAC